MAHSVRVRRAGLAVAALASVFLLAACASGAAAENYSGLPVSDGAGAAEGGEGESGETEGGEGGEEAGEGAIDEEALGEEPQVVWLREGAQLAVVIGGSSSCPSVGERIRVLEKADQGNRVAIDLVERPEDEVCTMDFVPHTTVFWTPTDVTTTEPLTVEVAGTTVTVPIK